MKKPPVFIILLALFFWFPIKACGQNQFESISHYQVRIRMLSDSQILVSEKIDYDFGSASHRGIIREVPYKYQARGGNYNLRISDVTATNELGEKQQLKVSYSGNKAVFRIGDPDVAVTGERSYVINYTVGRAINYFDSEDELYWTAVGTEWQVPIAAADASVTLPPGAEGKIKAACYTGSFGSTEANCEIIQESDMVSFVSKNPLLAGEGLTVVVALPKGILTVPGPLIRTTQLLEDNWILFLPVLAFGVMFAIWRSRGRDPLSKNPVVAQYESPDNLTPAELGYLINERSSNRDISAEIIHLAEKGYLDITKVEVRSFFGRKADYKLTKLKDESDLPNRFDRELVRALFADSIKNLSEVMPGDSLSREKAAHTVLVSQLSKTRNFRSATGISTVPERLVEEGYFPANPDKIKRNYMLGGIAVIMLAAWLGGRLSFYTIFSLILSGAIVLFFGYFMPARTQKGSDARQLALGLKEYLSVAEKDRLNFHNDPDKNPAVFEKMLPYAVALGVTTQWAQKFEGIYNQPPAWYHDPSSTAFNTLAFNSFVSDFSSSFNSAVNASASRQGNSSAWGGGSGFSGGFSGGGFGGGGGGSW